MTTPSPRRGLPAIFAAMLVFFLARPAHAGVELEVSSIFGDVRTDGELLVQIRNPEHRELRGAVTIVDRSHEEQVVARTPFVVGAEATRFVKVPVAENTYGSALDAVARDDAGKELGRAIAPSRANAGYLFLEIAPHERLLPFHVDNRRGGAVTLTTSPSDEATGATILPDRPSSYDSIALVLVAARDLEALDATGRDVLLAWVKGGGTLAVVVREPAELARPTLAGLVGAGVRLAPFEASQPEPQNADDTPPTLVPAVETRLTGYAGGRVHPARFGAAAEVGLGDVHLLAIDPWSKEANGDRWVQAQIVGIVAEPARTLIGRSYGRDFYTGRVLRALDANDSFRPALAIAALLLVLYAGGIVAVRRLAKRGTALAPYRWTFLASAATFGAIVVIGLVAKGGFGSRSRQLALVEVASGEAVGNARSYRSYYASRATALDVAASMPRSTFSQLPARGAWVGTSAEGTSTLAHVALRPWETLVVREDAEIALGQGITIDHDGKELVVTNRSGSRLVDAVISSAELGCLDLGTIADGASARSRDATRLEATICADNAKIPPAWGAFESAFLGRASPGRPTLLGELERAAAPADAGFRVERHTTLVRVVGGAS